jgi:multidrug efflux pump subunit AcrB
MEVAGALKMSNAQGASGSFAQADREIPVETGPFLQDADEVRRLMVGVHQGRPVYLRDVADVQDGSDELNTYARFGAGPAAVAAADAGGLAAGEASATVVVAVAKKKGSNAVTCRPGRSKPCWPTLRASVLPEGVEATIVRNYGATRNEKVNDLVLNLAMAC